MTSQVKTTLIVVLALTTIAGGVLAWQQNRALAALRANQARATSDDRTALGKRLADAEHRAHDLENQLAALKAHPIVPEDAPPEGPQAASDDRRGRFRGPGGREAFLAMMNDPKAVQLMNSREKLMLDSRYAALFKSLTQGANGANMTPEQLDAFKNLLVEKENTLRDVMMTARSQGVTDRSEINQLVKNAQAELDAQLEGTLGDAAYQQYQQYEQSLPERALVNQLSQGLSYTSTPLSDTQYNQLINLLAENAKSPSNKQIQNALGFGGGPGGYGGPTITDDAVAKAAVFLTPEQLLALANLQKLQKDQKALQKAASSQPAPTAPPPAAK
jgi:hypothetical protein